MGFFDFVGDVFSFSSVDAEAPGEDSSSKGQETEPRAAVTGGASNKTPASKEKESGEEAEVNKADAKSGGSTDEGHKASGDDEEGGEEEEEEEDDEPVDPKPKLEAECMKSKQCSADKHHYDECVERVTKAQESDEPSKENCVEEFFHLAHCATACAAPKLFKQLK